MTTENIYDNDDFDFPEISPREMACERLFFNTTEDILLAMQDSGMNQTDVAKKLGKSKQFVCQLLDGTRNMTLKTLSDIVFSLGCEVKVVICKDGRDVSHHIIPDMKSYVTKNFDINTQSKATLKIKITPQNMEFEQNVA